MHYNYHPMYYPDPFMHFLFIVLIIVFIAWVARAAFGPRRWHRRDMRWMTGHSSALDILEERYAKGEINKEEFESRRKDILAS